MESLDSPESLTENIYNPPDLLKTLDNETVETKAEWEQRRQEIRAMLQYYCYGIWRDGEKVSVTSATDTTMSIQVEHPTGATQPISFNATVSLPQGTAPEGGWPVMISASATSHELEYRLSQGYAVIHYSAGILAAEDRTALATAIKRINAGSVGQFYNLYPYSTSDWKEQTGTVMVWAWGISKIRDALETEMAYEKYHINAKKAIAYAGLVDTNYGGYGKAAACAGAFDDDLMGAYVFSSGYGGLTMSRYHQPSETYDLTSMYNSNHPGATAIPNLAEWSNPTNEPDLAFVNGGYYNINYEKFTSFEQMPFDAHFLAALYCMEDKYLHMATPINTTNVRSNTGAAGGLWYTYESVREVYEKFSSIDNIAINYQLGVGLGNSSQIDDIYKMVAFMNHHIMETTTDLESIKSAADGENQYTLYEPLLREWKLEDLQTCIFAVPENTAAYEAGKSKAS